MEKEKNALENDENQEIIIPSKRLIKHFALPDITLGDAKISVEYERLLSEVLDTLDKTLVYNITVKFCTEQLGKLLDDNDRDLIRKNYKEETVSSIIGNKLYLILKEIVAITEAKGLESSGGTIEGYRHDYNFIEIELKEHLKPIYQGKGKKRRLFKCFNTVPSVEYIQDESLKIIAKRLNDFYSNMKAHLNNEHIADILGIDSLDDNDLSSAFVHQYWKMFGFDQEMHDELFDKLYDNIKRVYKKHGIDIE